MLVDLLAIKYNGKNIGVMNVLTGQIYYHINKVRYGPH